MMSKLWIAYVTFYKDNLQFIVRFLYGMFTMIYININTSIGLSYS